MKHTQGIMMAGAFTLISNDIQEFEDDTEVTTKQLPFSSHPDKPILLAKLRRLIEQTDDSSLKPEERADALRQVEMLAEDPEKEDGLIRCSLIYLRGLAAATPALKRELNELTERIVELFKI